MSGSLVHSPADIIRTLLVDLGIGTIPTDSGAWPIYLANAPDSPDSIITITDTAPRKLGRIQFTGEVQENPGFQVAIRDADHKDGYEKADAIKTALDETIQLDTVSLDDNVGTGTSIYTVYAVSRTSGIIALGKDTPASKRYLFTINATVALRQTS